MPFDSNEARKTVTGYRNGEVLEKDSVDVVFEGVETTALKIKYKIKYPDSLWGEVTY